MTSRAAWPPRLEPFDSYWQAPKDVEKGFDFVCCLLPQPTICHGCRATSRHAFLS